jgi:hypothetical protein
MLYLVWYDADTRRSVGEKIEDARAAYVRRFHLAPDLILVNAVNATELSDIEVRSERTVQPHHFWVGRREAQDREEGANSNS